MIPLQLINYGVLNPGMILVDHINLCHVSCWDRFKHQSPRWGWFVDFQHPWATRPETRGLQRLGGLFILHEAQLLGICFKFVIPSYPQLFPIFPIWSPGSPTCFFRNSGDFLGSLTFTDHPGEHRMPRQYSVLNLPDAVGSLSSAGRELCWTEGG